MAPLAPAPGWAGEIKLGVEDSWEPTIAADPNAPYVYAMYNRFGGPKACNKCPGTPMYVRVSANNGVSWGPETYLCRCKGVKFQYDPVVKVASNGVVYATWMNGYDMMFSRSSNHGGTWRAPIEVSGPAWGDKPWIGVSPSGTDVYVAYETRDDLWVAASHDAGASFAPAVKLNSDSDRYRYPNGLEVLPDGTALLSTSSYLNGAGVERCDRDRDLAHDGWRRLLDELDPREPVLRRDLAHFIDDRPGERRSREPGGAVLGRHHVGRQRPRVGAPLDRQRGDVGAGLRAR